MPSTSSGTYAIQIRYRYGEGRTNASTQNSATPTQHATIQGHRTARSAGERAPRRLIQVPNTPPSTPITPPATAPIRTHVDPSIDLTSARERPVHFDATTSRGG